MEGETMIDTLKLKAAIVAKGYIQDDVAHMLGISFQSFNKKLNNKNEFKVSEVFKLSSILDITNVEEIFFCKESI